MGGLLIVVEDRFVKEGQGIGFRRGSWQME